MSEWLGDLGAKWRRDHDRVRRLGTQGAKVTRHVKDLFQDAGLNLDLRNTGEPLMIDCDRPNPVRQ